MESAETLRARLVAHYREVEATRMQGVPVLNPRLEVAATGFAPWQGFALGVVITPWFMNLLLLPLDTEAFTATAPRAGATRKLALPAGEVEFILSFEEDMGWMLACSLFSPMFEFESQAAALETAEAALAEVLNTGAEPDTPEPEMQQIWAGRLPEPEAEEEGEEPPAPPKSMDRRTFLRGTVPEAEEARR